MSNAKVKAYGLCDGVSVFWFKDASCTVPVWGAHFDENLEKAAEKYNLLLEGADPIAEQWDQGSYVSLAEAREAYINIDAWSHCSLVAENRNTFLEDCSFCGREFLAAVLRASFAFIGTHKIQALEHSDKINIYYLDGENLVWAKQYSADFVSNAASDYRAILNGTDPVAEGWMSENFEALREGYAEIQENSDLKLTYAQYYLIAEDNHTFPKHLTPSGKRFIQELRGAEEV